MGNTIRSVVMGSVDPFFDKRSSLYKSRVQLKIGFEIGSFRKIKKEVKELIPMDKLEDKGNEKVLSEDCRGVVILVRGEV